MSSSKLLALELWYFPFLLVGGLRYLLLLIFPSTLCASFLFLAIRIHIYFVGSLNAAFPQRLPLAKFFPFICLLFVRSEGGISHLPCFYDIAFNSKFDLHCRYINRIESRVHVVAKGERLIHAGNRLATVNYGASPFTA